MDFTVKSNIATEQNLAISTPVGMTVICIVYVDGTIRTKVKAIRVSATTIRLYLPALPEGLHSFEITYSRTVITGSITAEYVAPEVETFSGDYNDLTNKPTIPSDVSDLTDTTSLLAQYGVNSFVITEGDPLPGDAVSGDVIFVIPV